MRTVWILFVLVAWLLPMAGCDSNPNGPDQPDATSCKPWQEDAQVQTVVPAIVQVLPPGQPGWDLLQQLGSEEVGPLGNVTTVKALVLDASGPTPVVLFGNGAFHLHWEIAHAHDPVRFPNRQAFNDQVYGGAKRDNIAVTLLHVPDRSVPDATAAAHAYAAPLLWTLFPSDLLPLPSVRKAHKLLAGAVQMLAADGDAQRLVWWPSNAFHQTQASIDAAQMTAAGVLWTTPTGPVQGIREQAMNPGVAYGTLRQLEPEALAKTAVSYRDILLLPRLPLDLPLVGGTITGELQTQLAHVNVAARARQTPNVAVVDAAQDPRIAPFVGKTVRLEVTGRTFALRLATAAEVEEFWSKRLCRTPFVPKADLSVTGVHDMAAEKLGFESAAAFGVKAANYAELHLLFASNPNQVRAITDGRQDTLTTGSLAVPFSAYVAHIQRAQLGKDDVIGLATECSQQPDVPPEGCSELPAALLRLLGKNSAMSLQQLIGKMLQDKAFASQTALRSALLFALRWQIQTTPVDPQLAAQLDAAVLKRFGSHNVKLRSSTNAEDLLGFSGAGLYTSVSANGSGPETKLPSRRIASVWASVWSFRAFEERSFWQIVHQHVYMGVQINQSFPDELANGVLVTANLPDPTSWGYTVNAQKGEASVTNPENGITPEVFVVYWNQVCSTCPLEPYVQRLQFSSLSPGEPLLDDSRIKTLTSAAHWIQSHFANKYKMLPADLPLEMEWKLHDAERNIYLKQVRPF